MNEQKLVPVQTNGSAIIPPMSEAAAIIHIVDRMSRDPQVDVAKMAAILEMRRTIKAEEAEQAFWSAMNAAQAGMIRVRKDLHNPQTKSQYASYEALDRALRDIYTSHGFSLSYDTEESEHADHVRVVCYVAACGHVRKYRDDVPADGKGARGNDVMTKTHAHMSATTYGKRNLLKMIFNIVETGQDDDGNGAARINCITVEQADKIRKLVVESGANVEKFLAKVGAPSVPDIPTDKYQRAIDWLQTRKARAEAEKHV